MLTASVFYAPPAHAASFSSIPATINSYINNAFNFVGNIFSNIFAGNASTPTPTVPAPSTTTVINKTVYQYLPATTTPTTTTKTVYQYLPGTSSPAITVSPSGVTEAELTQKLAALQSTLDARTTQTINHYSDTSSTRTSGQSLTNLTVNGVTGLTSGDIPDLYASVLHSNKLCLSDASGTSCYTRTQLDAFLSGQGSAASAPTAPTPPATTASSTPAESSATTTAADIPTPDTSSPSDTASSTTP